MKTLDRIIDLKISWSKKLKMYKRISYLILLILFSCSTSDENSEISEQNPPMEMEESEEDTSSFEISLETLMEQAEVDDIIELTATANENIKSISYSLDNGVTFPVEFFREFGMSIPLYFSFDMLGTHTIIVRLRNSQDVIRETSLNIEVSRGSAVQITSLELNSFFNMGMTWDDEFPESDPNHLADVFFAFLKPTVDVFEGTRGGQIPSSSWLWHRSETRMNESNLSWLLEDELLYADIDQVDIYVGFADDDGGNLGQDLLLGPPSERVIPFRDFVATQPSSFIYTEDAVSLEYELAVDW